jgi:hypothetical protein
MRDPLHAIISQDNLALEIDRARAVCIDSGIVLINLWIVSRRYTRRSALDRLFIGQESAVISLLPVRPIHRLDSAKGKAFGGLAGWHFWGKGLARKCHLQNLALRLTSQVSSSGGGLPGRPGLERVSGRSLFLGWKFRGSNCRVKRSVFSPLGDHPDLKSESRNQEGHRPRRNGGTSRTTTRMGRNVDPHTK